VYYSLVSRFQCQLFQQNLTDAKQIREKVPKMDPTRPNSTHHAKWSATNFTSTVHRRASSRCLHAPHLHNFQITRNLTFKFNSWRLTTKTGKDIPSSCNRQHCYRRRTSWRSVSACVSDTPVTCAKPDDWPRPKRAPRLHTEAKRIAVIIELRANDGGGMVLAVQNWLPRWRFPGKKVQILKFGFVRHSERRTVGMGLY